MHRGRNTVNQHPAPDPKRQFRKELVRIFTSEPPSIPANNHEGEAVQRKPSKQPGPSLPAERRSGQALSPRVHSGATRSRETAGCAWSPARKQSPALGEFPPRISLSHIPSQPDLLHTRKRCQGLPQRSERIGLTLYFCEILMR